LPTVANRIIEVSPKKLVDYQGPFKKKIIILLPEDLLKKPIKTHSSYLIKNKI
tara:strand:+ start:327 stop:485 length:159 start_codon:yes stop_codon:yes gene_type:complete